MLNSRTDIVFSVVGLTLFCVAVPATGQIVIPDIQRGGPLATPLPPIIVPVENPLTEEKRVLGKVLFWDDQLSSDNTRACGSCHFPASGGTDPERFPNPGPDSEYGTIDDRFTSRGLIRALKDGNYDPDPAFGLDPQATKRSAPSTLMAAYFGDMFWDGRAMGEFRDPETGEVVIPFNASLESQAAEPVLSSVEMAHEDRDWSEVSAKLERSVPLALARDIPADVADAIGSSETYPDLFEAAFGDPAINASRIAMAIATYERTLIPDQSPWDRYVAGETDAMTPEQTEGWFRFSGNLCVVCHTPPHFSDFNFHAVGVRPNSEDPGLGGVTKLQEDVGLFKTPSLRNAGLKSSFMHTGGARSIKDVLKIYAAPSDDIENPNRSLFLPIVLQEIEQDFISTFVTTALDDPRAANEEFPFDRPTLYEEWADGEWAGGNPSLLAGGRPGSQGISPRTIAAVPPNVGNEEFRIGLANALGGSVAFVAISSEPPVNGVVAEDTLEGPFDVLGTGAGGGYATFLMPIPADQALEGDVLYMQWRIADPAALGGVALSNPVRVALFCNGRCPGDGTDGCPADLAPPVGQLDLADLQAFLSAFLSSQPDADFADPIGVLDLADVQAFVSAFLAGCP